MTVFEVVPPALFRNLSKGLIEIPHVVGQPCRGREGHPVARDEVLRTAGQPVDTDFRRRHPA
jgi:hypothetical protein